MTGGTRDPRSGTHPEWPWEPDVSRITRSLSARIRIGGAWPLTAATLAVLAVLVGGYGWLGSVVGGAPGALAGAAAGLTLSGLLYLLVGRAMSGPRPVNRPGRAGAWPRRSAH